MIRRVLWHFVNANRPGSLGDQARRRRYRQFRALLDPLPRPVRILDIGGNARYWHSMGLTDEDGVQITTVNLSLAYDAQDDVPLACVARVVGDARRLATVADDAFDIAFSNSVIEHVGGEPEQAQMATEMHRVAARYYLQTPCRYFPLEPHFMFPFFGLLPVRARVWLLRHVPVGHNRRVRDAAVARELAESVNLPRLGALRRMFPDGEVHRERLLGLTKSYVVVGGFTD